MVSPNEKLPTIEDIKYARKILSGKINITHLEHSTTFSRRFDADIWFKPENFQKTGSFKIRGAIVKLSTLSDRELSNGVITVSAGNHAQGVALASRIMGTNAKIVMPVNTTPAKIEAVENYGASIVLAGEDYHEARSVALKLSENEGRTFIEGFDDRWIIAGQGTIGLEILDELPSVEQVIVPVGGGGLISGIAIGIKSLKKDVSVIGVQSATYDSFKRSLETGRMRTHVVGHTIADGIAIREPGKLNIKVAKRYVDRVITVDDESIATAVFNLLERNKMVVEPAGAAGFAAIISGRINVSGRKVAVVLSGGNINPLLLSKIIYKSMGKEDRLVRFVFNIPDRPGVLYRISKMIWEHGGSIYHSEVDNLKGDTPTGYQNVSFTVSVRNRAHRTEMENAIRDAGWDFTVESDS